VIVAITTENVEASTVTAATVIKKLIARFTMFHAVSFATAKSGTTAGAVRRDGTNTSIPARSQQLGQLNTEGEGDRERNRLLQQGTAAAAGSLQRVVNATALSTPLLRLAAEFAYSYRLTFAGPPPDQALKDLQIGLFVEGVTVRAIAAPDMARQSRSPVP
jgi:hypothetical protein